TECSFVTPLLLILVSRKLDRARCIEQVDQEMDQPFLRIYCNFFSHFNSLVLNPAKAGSSSLFGTSGHILTGCNPIIGMRLAMGSLSETNTLKINRYFPKETFKMADYLI